MTKRGGGTSRRPRRRRPGGGRSARARRAAAARRPAARTGDRRAPMPAVGRSPTLDFPAIERATLSNGIQVVYARRTAVPVTRVAVEFDAGIAADPADRLGTQALMLNLLDEGTTHAQLDRRSPRRRSGSARRSAPAPALDRTSVVADRADAESRRLARSAGRRRSAIRPSRRPRSSGIRSQQLAGIAAEMTQPQGIALRALPPLIYGAAIPMACRSPARATPAAVRALTRDDLVAFHQRLDPARQCDDLRGRRQPLAEIVPLLEARFGNWAAPATPRGTKTFTARIAGAAAADRADRSAAIAAVADPRRRSPAASSGTDDLLHAAAPPTRCSAAASCRGSTWICARRKGWSYGVGGAPQPASSTRCPISSTRRSRPTRPAIRSRRCATT